jgi:hypothetical protein
VMQNQLGSGLDPLELQRLEAIKILAEHPSEGTLTDNRPQIINQVLPQPPTTPAINPVIVAGTPFLASPQTQNIVNSAPANAAQPPAAQSEAMSREEIVEILDKLDKRLVDGEISEQIYLTLQDKWQKRLSQLP